MRTLTILLALLAALLGGGCYTTTTIAALPTLHTRVPVSASGHYVANDGAIVGPADVQPVRTFELEQTVRGTLHGRAVRQLRLDAALDALALQAGGDALTRVELIATEYSPGGHYATAFCRTFGWIMLFTAASLVPFAATVDQGEVAAYGYYTAGAVAGTAALFLLLAEAVDTPPEWHVTVRGTVVRRTGTRSGVPVPITAVR